MTTPPFRTNHYPKALTGVLANIPVPSQELPLGTIYNTEDGAKQIVVGSGLNGQSGTHRFAPLGLASFEQNLGVKTTVGAVPQTVVSFTPPAPGLYLISIRVGGVRNDDTSAAWFVFSGGFRFQGGACTAVGTTTKTTQADGALGAATCVEALGAAYAIVATGVAGLTVDWQAYASFFQVL